MCLALDCEKKQADEAASKAEAGEDAGEEEANPKEEEGSDDDSDDGKAMTEEEKKEGERLYKREQALHRALRVMLTKNPEGVDVPDVLSVLESLGVKNFKPQMLKYETMRDLLENVPEFVLTFVDGEPPRVMPAE